MQYDPARYSATAPPQQRRHLVDRWSTESRRSYTKRDPEATVVVEGRPAPPPMFKEPAPVMAAPRTITEMVKAVKQVGPHTAPYASAPAAPMGSVAGDRPPFHCYNLDSANVLPPRPIREETYYQQVAEAHTQGDLASTQPRIVQRAVRLSAPLGCAGCKFCHHEVSQLAAPSMADHAEDVALRRDAMRHRQRHQSKGTASKNSNRQLSNAQRSKQGPAPLPVAQSASTSVTPLIAEVGHSWSQLRRTSLVLCAPCGRVTNRSCDSDEAIQRFLDAPCEQCGVTGSLMRLLAEDNRRPSTAAPSTTTKRSPATHVDPAAPVVQDRPQSRQTRPHTPLDDFVDVLELLPQGVVPMEDRRTALGERIRVGRARVPSPARQAAIDVLSGTSTNDGRLQKWLNEPQSANDSDKAKLCMTWDA